MLDGLEPQPGEDSDGEGALNVADADSDDDGLFDGTELGVTEPHADTDGSLGAFVPDANPDSTTDPLSADTDLYGRSDGAEDVNRNGRLDDGETDPTHLDTFCSADAGCGQGERCSGTGVCEPTPPPEIRESGDAEEMRDGGCTSTAASLLAFLSPPVSSADVVRARRDAMADGADGPGGHR